MSITASLGALLSPRRVLTRPLDLAAYASDASFYTLTPAAVVRPQDTAEIKALFAWSARQRVPLTFRAAGTSLSGQAITNGVLIDLSRHWRTLEIQDGGARVRVGPGVVGGIVNAHLARYGKKLGPDPASIGSCMIGGIVANNSSGMCCGIEHNAYRTLLSLRFVLPSGTYYNEYFPGHALAMPPPLSDKQVDYPDGSPTTVDQYSKDVATFMMWAAEPHLEARKRIGFQVMIFLLVLAGLLYFAKKKVWADAH